jgi:mRNA interferase RelE/StbE
MQIKIQNTAYKDLKKIDNIQVQKILKSISTLNNYPNVSNIKKLTNHNPPFRLRVGNYRVLFDIEDNILIISRIKHRKESY